MGAAQGLARASARGGPDRLERESHDFHERVAGAFARFRDPAWQQEHPECGPVVAVDGVGSEAEVARRVAEALAVRWPESFSTLAAFVG